jgi:hypothetical protein
VLPKKIKIKIPDTEPTFGEHSDTPNVFTVPYPSEISSRQWGTQLWIGSRESGVRTGQTKAREAHEKVQGPHGVTGKMLSSEYSIRTTVSVSYH